VLGRTGGHFDEIRFADLGLDPAKPYLVFEYWQRRGDVAGHATSFVPGPLPTPFNAQAFIIRERLDRPQVVATNRHITGGGVDLVDMSWKDGVLSGRSRVVANDPYELYLTEPDGWTLDGVECDGAAATPTRRESGMAIAGCLPTASSEIGWRARFTRRAR
jgi:hypothetical protein